MAFIKRFSTIKRGGIVFIGNTLGLSKFSNLNSAGLLGSIGAFTSLDTSLKVNDFPFGTTLDYTKNGSSATLNLPAGSNILYAELVWGGLFRSSTNNISNLIDNSINFTTPIGIQTVFGDVDTKQTFNININNTTLGFYVRSANVTSSLQQSGNGIYSVSGVPALIEAIDSRTSDTNHAGWTLAVVYSNNSLEFKSLNLWTGGVVVSPTVGVTNILLTGFKTPNETLPSGKLFVSAQEGDSVISGDQMLFGEDSITYTNLSGPNNPLNNFFCSQINGSDGLIDTSGTFGTRNANAQLETNTNACRQGYDITAIDLTGKINPLQTTAAIRFTSNGDLYVPNCLAIEIENGADAELSVVKYVDKNVAIKGETLQYKTVLTNSGSLVLTDILFTDDIPIGTSFISGSVEIDGINFPSYNPQDGFMLNNLNPGSSTEVTFKVEIL